MRKIVKLTGLALLALSLGWAMGCKPANSSTAPATLAPGYSNSADQQLGQALAALNGFVTQEKANYAAAAPDIQAAEKAPLNSFILAVNLANASYTAYHAGTQTFAQAQTAVANAQSAQSALVAAKGVK